MSAPLLKPLRWLACFLVLNLAIAQAAMAAPATKASLQKYFEVNNVASLASRTVETMSSVQAKEWQDETDPAKKAEKKAQFDKTDAVIRKHVSWAALEPLALEAYTRMLTEQDVLDLIAYAESPGGRLHVTKLTPAIVDGLPKIMAYLSTRVEEFAARKEGDKPVEKVLTLPPPGSKQALAYTLVLEMPGAKDDFTLRMSTIEEAMLKNVDMLLGDENSEMRAVFKRIATGMKRDISYEEVALLKSSLIADKLSEAELSLLIADHRKAPLKALLSKQSKAEHELAQVSEKHVQEKLLPLLMDELLLSKDEAAKPAKAAKKKPVKK